MNFNCKKQLYFIIHVMLLFFFLLLLIIAFLNNYNNIFLYADIFIGFFTFVLWKEEGFMSMYRGLGPHVFRVLPSTAILFGVFEAVMKYLGTSTMKNS